jgi:hypothetical protein
MSEKEKITYTGFIAQEVEAAAQASDFDFSGVDKPKSATDVYGLRYAEFVAPLVKAIQEQQDIIARQKNKISDLQQMVDELKKEITLITKTAR